MKKHVIKKYSKSSNFYNEIKTDFFSQNERLLKNALKINKLYSKQKKRTSCKLCGAKLKSSPDFRKHNIQYVFCRECDHLNGVHTDSREFANKIYSDDDGSKYSNFYLDDKYESRIQNIYMPKIEFIDDYVDKGMSIFDFGCGLGHFVDSALRLGYDAKGADVSKVLVKNGNLAIKHKHDIEPLHQVKSEEVSSLIQPMKVDILSALAVMEHLVDLESFINSVKKCELKYFYYSVPTYGLSVSIETVFEEVFPRHLSSGHTHLFTEKSLELLHKKLGVKPIAQWRFGTDIMDFRRSLDVMLKKADASDFFRERVFQETQEYGDKLQNIIDESHNCSQIHVLTKKI